MLVIMTYQTQLFILTIFGLSLGHFLFNIHAPVSEKPDPCCAEAGGVGAHSKSGNGNANPPSSSLSIPSFPSFAHNRHRAVRAVEVVQALEGAHGDGGGATQVVLEVDGMTCMANCGSMVKGALLQVRIGVHGSILRSKQMHKHNLLFVITFPSFFPSCSRWKALRMCACIQLDSKPHAYSHSGGGSGQDKQCSTHKGSGVCGLRCKRDFSIGAVTAGHSPGPKRNVSYSYCIAAG